MLTIDGSEGEGGGQILRSSLALSLLTGTPFRLDNIRARRPKPGLAAQHLQSVLAAARVGSAHVLGASLGSSSLTFEPGPVSSGTYRFDIGTAGATGLVLHTIYIPLALRGDAASEVTLTGGTLVKTSPTYPYLADTWAAWLAPMGLAVRLRLDRHGFYPRGGGSVRAVVSAVPSLSGIVATEAEPATTVRATAVVAGLPDNIATRLLKRAASKLAEDDLDVTTEVETSDNGPGVALILRADTKPVPTTVVGLGERGKPADKVADEAVAELLAHLRTPCCADVHAADQIVLPLALAAGRSEFTVSEVSQHLMTNIDVIGRFVEREIRVEGELGKRGRVTVV